MPARAILLRGRHGSGRRVAAVRTHAPSRSRPWIAWALLAALSCTGCASYAENRVLARHAPLREPSLAPWATRFIGAKPAMQFILDRSALIFGRADEVELERSSASSVTVSPLRDGQPLQQPPTAGSATPLSEDGYFLTAAHCVDEEPYVVVLRDRHGRFVSGRGRTVWDGFAGRPRVDLALIHVPGVEPVPFEWREIAEVPPGAEILCAGFGLSESRLAAGRLVGGPVTESEAAPGQAHRYAVDVPLVRGDSGGPAMLSDGGLVGVCTGIDYQRFGATGRGEVLRPDPFWLASLIEVDRARRVAVE